MNRRAMTVYGIALAWFSLLAPVASAQMPEGWIPNWDGSGTYVFLGDPGTGNVGRTPGRVDIPQARYSAAHPGWYAQLLEHVRAYQQGDRPQVGDNGPGRSVPEGRGEAQGEGHDPRGFGSRDHPEGEGDRTGREHPPLPEGWVPNWDGSDTYVFLGSPGTGNVGHVPGRVDIPQERYSAVHPGWYGQLLERVRNYQDHPEERGGWGERNHSEGFSDHDRRVTHEWLRENRGSLGPGWRPEDRLSPEDERGLRPGERLDWRLRRQLFWLPDDLTRRYGPARRDYRYGVIGGHVVMLDGDFEIVDEFRADADDR